jgi:hypothetical protein
LKQQLTETPGANTEPVLANGQKQRQLGRIFGAINLTAPVAAARNVGHNCCHHWVIEIAAAPLSQGVCRLCGEEKLFRNSTPMGCEIAPVRVMNGGRQANDSMNIPQQVGEYAPLLAQSRYGRPIALQSAGRGY